MMQSKQATGRRNFDSLKQIRNQPDIRSTRNGIYIVRPESRLSFGFLFAVIGFCLACTQPTSLDAQLAHFSGAVRPLGSGFTSPAGVAVDGSGNVFVADFGSNTVKEILAVNGSIPASPAINTLGSGFNEPQGVAVDGSGNVFVIDAYNEVKEILASGGYTTVNTLGSGFGILAGVAVDGSGNVFVADFGGNAVKEILAAGGYTTINTLGSGFDFPVGVAVDGSGNVFIIDSNNAVKEILAAGGYTTVNTLGSGFNEPQGVAVDGSGNVFVTDSNNNAVREILAAGGYTTINTLGSGFNFPVGVAVDGSGNVFVGDAYNNAVKEITTAGGNFGQVNVGSSSSSPITLAFTFFTFDTGGTLGSTAVLTQGAAGLDFTDAGTGTCKAGTVYFTSDICTVDVIFKPGAPGTRYGSAELLNSSGNLLATGYVQGTGVGPQVNFLPGVQSILAGGLTAPYGLAVDASGNVFIADPSNGMVREIEAGGGPTRVHTLGSGFDQPFTVALDGSGNVFVADYGNGEGNGAIKEILAAGDYTTVITLGSGFEGPFGVAVDGSGNVFVADFGQGAVKEILAAGGYATVNTLGSGFGAPEGLAVDGFGNVFVADTKKNAVNEILAAGGYTTVNTLGSGFSQPHGVAVDASGNIYVADESGAVKEILAAGGYTTINTLGSGIFYAVGVAVDGSGNVFVADSGNERVEKLDYADPPSLNFATTPVGSISSDSPQAVTVENIGNATLAAAASGVTFPADFKRVTGRVGGDVPADCGLQFSLSAGASCRLRIEFAPVSAGNPISEALVITDNSLNAGAPGFATQSIHLSGISPVPAPSLSASSLSFGSVKVGATSGSQSVTLTNTGSEALSITGISVTGANASSFVFGYSCGTSLAAGANCTIHGHFTPTAAGALTAAVTITDDASNSPQSIMLSGTGIGPPIVSLSASTLSFGNENVGVTSASKSITLTNTGTGPLAITSIAVTGANASSFVFANSCGASVAAETNCSIHGHFTPATAGAMTAEITITDNAGSSPQSISLSGTGLSPAAVSLSASSLSFGGVKLGSTSASQSVTLTNTGTGSLTITSIAVTGADASSFGFANSCGTSVAAGANCTIHGHFTPAAARVLTAAVTITDNATNSPQSISLSGTGVAPPAVSLSASSLSFGSVKLGSTSASQSVTLTNTGTGPLTISSIVVTGADASSFGFANSCGTSVAAGANCTIHGHFTPAAAGALTAAITITDNASGSPQSIALSGTGN
jgi:DNA-binding beta-propeller fold protein YncE